MIIPAILLAGQLTVAVAGGVPHINVEASCRAAIKAAVGLNQDLSSCLQSENSARDQLAKEWSKVPSADRVNCLALTTTGTTGTYTELLTCVEMKRDARQLPEEKGTVGRGM